VIIEFIPFDPSVIIPEGKYWIITETKYKKQHFSANVKQSGNKMNVMVTNQKVTHISTEPIK
jgi:hypothetical protein